MTEETKVMGTEAEEVKAEAREPEAESVEKPDTAQETVETMEDYAGQLEASFRKINEGDILTGTVIAVNEEEAVLDLNYYAQGIIKATELSNDPDFSILRDVQAGDSIEATVISVDDGQGNILLSKKEANEVLAWDKLQSWMEEEKECTVRVKETVNAGVVAFLEGIRGFIPASHLSMDYVEDTAPYVGKELSVRVITVDREKKKLVLSHKVIAREKAKEERDHKISMIVPGSILEGTVESLMPYGAFISLGDGLSGLVHISQISMRRIKKPSEVLNVGDSVKVKVLNTNDHKISLSIKAVAEDNEAEELKDMESYQYKSEGEATTSLGDLFKNLKF